MPKGKIVVFMGSKKDYEFASRINKFLKQEGFGIQCDYLIASAHKTPQKLLEEVNKHEGTEEPIVFITVAGLSDALSGVVAGATSHPVVACPPDLEKFGWAKFFSSAVTPQGISVAYVPRPENAALSAVKMIALSDPALRGRVKVYMQRLKEIAKAKI
ncbi:MAG: AIR carboxylase family protein [Candidatus Bathyarchaeota archaeon]|nr:MAG: AIR carboxylase family protein [Candidatus Bathyarchaeota archaeon]